MAISFPQNPNVGDVFSFGGRSWRWSGYAWTRIPDPGAKGQGGDKGDKGDRGLIGDEGQKGSKGEPSTVKGEKGDKGGDGQKGSTGSGSKGEKGIQGNGGFKGDTGSPGDKGNQGDKGNKGDSGTGGGGASVTIGINPPTSPAPNQGDLWWDSDDSDLHVYYNDGNSAQWVSVTSSSALKGAKGEKGQKGDKGQKGEKGNKGDKGNKGQKGEIGPEGGSGGIGDKGNQGDKGSKGDDNSTKGNKGDKGQKGESIKGQQGDAIKGQKGDGDKGDKGDKGIKGDSIKGQQGDATKGQKGDGDKGDKGDKGLPGNTTKGDKGAPGADNSTKGDKGAPGADNSTKGQKGEPGTAAITNNANNRILTATGSATINAEANLTFDGTNLDLGDSKAIRLGNAPDMTIVHDGSGGGINMANGSLTVRVQNAAGKGFYIEDPNGTATIAKFEKNSVGGAGRCELMYAGLKKLETTNSGVTITGDLNVTGSTTGSAGVPIGTIVAYGGNSAPPGWLLCDGQSTASYTTLRSVVGNNVPDLRNRFVIGAGSSYSLDATGGASSKTLGTNNLPAHTHTAGTYDAVSNGAHTHTYVDQYVVINNGYRPWPANNNDCAARNANTGGNGAHTHAITGNSGTQGGTMGQSFSLLPPYWALTYIIKY